MGIKVVEPEQKLAPEEETEMSVATLIGIISTMALVGGMIAVFLFLFYQGLQIK